VHQMSKAGSRSTSSCPSTRRSSVTFPLIHYRSIVSLGIDGSLLDHIQDEDLQSDFGIAVRLHRVKIIEGIKKLQVQAQSVTQLQQ